MSMPTNVDAIAEMPTPRFSNDRTKYEVPENDITA